MRISIKESLPQVVLVILVVVGLSTVLVAGSASSEAFNPFNPGWEGSSAIRSVTADAGGSVTVLTGMDPYDNAGNDTVVFILAPTERYSASELERLRSFVRRGGTLVVAEDFSERGNEVLSGIRIGMRFDGRLVADQRHRGPTPEMPVATNVTRSQYTNDVDSVMLNHGTVLTNTTKDTVLVRTSRFAYLDENMDGSIGNATLQQYPVVVAEPVGSGVVIAVSDPSIFINTMQERESNAAFVRGLVGDADRVFLDYSHTSAQPPVHAALLWLRRTPMALAALGTVGLTLVAWGGRRGLPVWLPLVHPQETRQRTSVDKRSMLAYVRHEHPEWNLGHAKQLIKSSIIDESDRERDT